MLNAVKIKGFFFCLLFLVILISGCNGPRTDDGYVTPKQPIATIASTPTPKPTPIITITPTPKPTPIITITPTPTPTSPPSTSTSGNCLGGYQGIVLDDVTGQKIKGVRITFVSEDGKVTENANTNANGYYRIALCKGRYVVTATHPDYETYSSFPGFFVVPDNDYHTGNIDMKKKL